MEQITKRSSNSNSLDSILEKKNQTNANDRTNHEEMSMSLMKRFEMLGILVLLEKIVTNLSEDFDDEKEVSWFDLGLFRKRTVTRDEQT